MNRDTDLMYNKRWNKRKNSRGYATILIVMFILLIILIGHNLSHKEIQVVPTFKKSHAEVPPSMREIAMREYFRRKGSPVPHTMAKAVLATSQPRLMASIAVRESNGNPKAIGDGGASKGAFQVKKKHWKHLLYEKKVSNDAVTQALDSERILEALVAENNGNLKKALNDYGGDRSRKVYAKNILDEIANVP